MTDRDRLKALLVERSVTLGDFTLASGARSDYYIDARVTTMSADGQHLVGAVAYARIREEQLDVTHVGGPTMGADPVAYAVAHRSALEGAPIDGFSVRKQAKAHGTGRRIEGGLPENARCVVVEDTITTGGSLLEAVAVLRAHGAEVVAALVVVDRSERAQERFSAEGLSLLRIFSGSELLEAARAAGSEAGSVE